jgi:hypothetical protein
VDRWSVHQRYPFLGRNVVGDSVSRRNPLITKFLCGSSVLGTTGEMVGRGEFMDIHEAWVKGKSVSGNRLRHRTRPEDDSHDECRP